MKVISVRVSRGVVIDPVAISSEVEKFGRVWESLLSECTPEVWSSESRGLLHN